MSPLSFPTLLSPACHARRFQSPSVMPDIFNRLLSCQTFSIAPMSFPTSLIGNPRLFPRRGRTNERDKKEKHWIPAFAGMTEGVRRACQKGAERACQRGSRRACQRGTERECQRSQPGDTTTPLSFPTLSIVPLSSRHFPPLSFPTFVIGNPWVFPRQGRTNERDRRKTLDSRFRGNDRRGEREDQKGRAEITERDRAGRPEGKHRA